MSAKSLGGVGNEHGGMMRQVFSLRWILTTLLVIAAMGVMARLGIWQLDRLAQRRALNASIEAGMALPPLDLNRSLPSLDQLAGMTYRAVKATGVYAANEEVIWRNQIQNGQVGFEVLTPLQMDGSQYAILVDRGWAPLEMRGQLAAFTQSGPVTVAGRLMPSQAEPSFGGVPDPALASGQQRLDAWNFVNLERIGKQVSRPLLPVFLLASPLGAQATQAAQSSPGAQGGDTLDMQSGLDALVVPGAAQTALPSVPGQNGLVRVPPVYDLSEGPHESYALQWFAFALTLGIGYPFYVRKQLRHSQSRK